jgi:hypothetical protein
VSGGVVGQGGQLFRRVGADHDRIHEPRQDPRRILDGLAAAELHFLGAQHHGLAAELADTDLETDPRAG